jgi:sugar lactone lactonase YvrE
MRHFVNDFRLTLSRAWLPVILVLFQGAARGQSGPVYVWGNFAGQPGSPGTAEGTGTAAQFNNPGGVTVDSAGNVYVADTYNCTIRKLTSGGAVTTLAGSAGNSGADDGTNGAARFNYPNGVAVDGAGNVYVADTWSHTIRRITSAGAVTTLAGNAGNYGTNDGPGSEARFFCLSGVAVDGAGTLYVADQWNHTVRRVTSAGVVTTLAGLAGNSGTNDGTATAARFNNPSGVAVDTADNVFVADLLNHTIRKITSAGSVTTLAGLAEVSGTNDGPGSAARFNYPNGVAVDGAGNVFVADRLNHTIRKVTSAGMVTTLGGSAGLSGTNDGFSSIARFNLPYGVAADTAGNLFVADTFNHRISKGIPLPALTIRRSGNGVVVSWPSPSTGFVPQENANVANPLGWSTSGYPVTDDGVTRSITILSPVGNLFFRLTAN